MRKACVEAGVPEPHFEEYQGIWGKSLDNSFFACLNRTGKTTLFRMLIGEEQPDGGSIVIAKSAVRPSQAEGVGQLQSLIFW